MTEILNRVVLSNETSLVLLQNNPIVLGNENFLFPWIVVVVGSTTMIQEQYLLLSWNRRLPLGYSVTIGVLGSRLEVYLYALR